MDSKKYEKRIDQFEQKVVLRVSRSIYLAFAGLATLSLIGAVLIVVYGLTPTVRGGDPPEPDVPPQQTVGPQEVLAALEEASDEDIVVERWAPEADLRSAISEGTNAADDPMSARLEALLTEIATYFDETRFPWLSMSKSVCASKNWFGDCIRWEKRVSQRGVLTLLDRGTQGLTVAQRVEFLDGVLSTIKLVDAEETRFLAVRAVADMRAAYQRPAGPSLAALVDLFAPPPAKRQPLSEGQKAQILEVILQIQKRDAPEETLATFLPTLPRLCGQFSPDEAVVAADLVWVLIGRFSVDELETRLAELHAVLEAAPPDLRVTAIGAFAQVLADKNRRTAEGYESALAERRARIRELDDSYSDRRERKEGARTMGVAGILSGLATIAVIGLLLGLLAVERNTRLLREVLGEAGPVMGADAALAPVDLLPVDGAAELDQAATAGSVS